MRRILLSVAATAASALVLTGCATATATGAADDGRVQVVASTNVYGALAAEIGGDRVQVTSLIDSAAKDPHSYEATARDRLAVQKADLVIENGGGYDSFMTELIDGHDPVVITAVEFSHDYPGATVEDDAHAHEHDDHAHAGDEEGHEGHGHIAGFNEHVWFDVHTITHVVEQIAQDLGELDAVGRADFAAAAKTLITELDGIETDLHTLHDEFEGQHVFITEPLPGLLAGALGLHDVTPDGFASAVEEGNDVAPATLLAALSALKDDHVRAVLTNAQTGGSETQRIEQTAKDAGIPVLTFTELLGPDQSYAEWMRAAISEITTGLRR